MRLNLRPGNSDDRRAKRYVQVVILVPDKVGLKVKGTHQHKEGHDNKQPVDLQRHDN